MKSLLSFFTRLPIDGRIETASSTIYLIGVIALIIGLVPFVMYVVIGRFVPRTVLTLILLLSIYFLTGLLHLDGLADFSDGVMKKGGRDQKVRALKDVNTGVAGIFAVITVLLSEFYAINSLKLSLLGVLTFFVVSEISSKVSMISGLTFFKVPETGLAHEFKKGFKWYYMPLSLIIIAPTAAVFGFQLLNVLAGVIISLIIGEISYHNFGFVNGDSLGAMNEISRAVTMWLICLGL
ncbi:MAG: adenosylcobinamide-GDP ribazoletransferase [Thermoplasmatales archaeon]